MVYVALLVGLYASTNETLSPQLQSIRSRTTTTTSLASSDYVPMPDVLLAGQELEDCWEEPEEDKGEES